MSFLSISAMLALNRIFFLEELCVVSYFRLILLSGFFINFYALSTDITRATKAFSKKEEARREYAALMGRALSIYLEKKEPQLLEELSDSQLDNLVKKVCDLLEGWYPGTEDVEDWELDEAALLLGSGSLFDGSREYRIAMDICYALKKRTSGQPVQRGYHWFY